MSPILPFDVITQLIFMFVNLVFASIVLLGCTSAKTGRAVGWLNQDRVVSTMERQYDAISKSEEAFAAQVSRMLAVRTNADFVIKLLNEKEVLISQLENTAESTHAILINDVRAYCVHHAKQLSFDLAVVIIPYVFPADEGKPSQLDIVRDLDYQLRLSGFKRRIFQISEAGHWYQLDSKQTE